MSEPVFVPAPARTVVHIEHAARVAAASATEPSALESATRIVTAMWLALSGINFVVWLLVSIISGSIDSPWFLWTFAGGAVVVGGLKVAKRQRWSS